MKNIHIQEAVSQINISENMQQEIIDNLHRNEADGKYKYKYKTGNFRKALATAALLLLAVGIVSIPAQASIRYLIKERMESIPLNEMEEYSQMVQNQAVGADGFSRKYSSSERERMAELYKAYQKGTFPQEKLLLVESENQISKDVLCYMKSTGFFYFPDREMTDEELLEIIEFNYERDYSLTLDPEVQSVLEEKKQEQLEIKAQVQDNGGICEEEALEIVKNYMNSFLGVSTDGMEETVYLDNETFEVPTYHITYDIRSNCYYYFSVSTMDGQLMSISISIAAWRDAPDITEEQAKERIPENYQAARHFLTEDMGISDDFENVYCLYVAEEGNVVSRDIAFYFIKADQNAYKVNFCCAGNEFSAYMQTTRELYQQTSERDNIVSVVIE